MPRNYEMTLIVDPQLAEGTVDDTVTRYQTLIAEHGSLVHVDRLGTRKLAYDIRKRQQGDYSFIQFHAEPTALAVVDRACRLDEAILRHMIVTVPGGFLIAKPKVEGAAEEDADGAVADSDDTTEEEVE
jgi:small subunit ribosomal protein S6